MVRIGRAAVRGPCGNATPYDATSRGSRAGPRTVQFWVRPNGLPTEATTIAEVSGDSDKSPSLARPPTGVSSAKVCADRFLHAWLGRAWFQSTLAAKGEMSMQLPRLPFSIIAVVFACLSGISVAADARPNVLFIAVDDMNDWVGCLGGYGGEVHTPHIDRLAARGLLFENAHCAAPVCNPSRTAILTGLRPSTSGVYDNDRWWRPALPDVVTLPEHFAQNGYQVAGGGKLYHHSPGFNPPGQWHRYFPQVFDDAWHRPAPGEALPVSRAAWPKGFPLCELENVRLERKPPANPLEFDFGPFDKTDLEMGDGQMVTWAQQFLAQQHDGPFFLAAGIFRPHLPWYAPRKYFEMYPLEAIVLPTVPDDDLDDIPEAGRQIATYRGDEWLYLKEQNRWRHAVQAYLASITFADALVGQLLAALDESEYAENTIVVLWSDHGWHLGEKHHWHKFTLWERATRVPLVITAPGVTKAGTRSTKPVNLIDLYPTLVDLCGLPANERLDGVNLKPLLRDPQSKWDRPSLTTLSRGNHSLRTERYRYIRYADGSEEFYDHQSDPNEWRNLAGLEQHAPLKQQLSEWFPENEAQAAPNKGAYRFDPVEYTWTPKQ